jgi:cytochrome P450
MMGRRPDAPVYRGDLYSPAAIADPHPVYAERRALGPVVWLSKQRALALTRYEECKNTLLNDGTFISGKGVALSPVTNRFSRGTTLNSDGEETPPDASSSPTG